MMPTDGDVLRAVTDALTHLIGPELIARSEFTVTRLKMDASGGEFVIHALTPDSARLLAQFVPFNQNSFAGFALPFVRGWLASQYRECGRIHVHLDVASETTLGVPQPLYRVVAITDDAVAAHLRQDKQLVDALYRHGTELLLLAGETVAGPSVAMMATAAALVRIAKFGSVLDGYSGSGGVAAASLHAGATKVVSVDTAEFPPVAPWFARYGKRWSGVTDDAISVIEGAATVTYDLVTLDPFYGDLIAAIDRLRASHAMSSARFFLVNGGFSALRHWQVRVSRALASALRVIGTHDLHGERVYFAVSRVAQPDGAERVWTLTLQTLREDK
jgi:16S rRNA G966 N2-methylase RsmD